MIETNYLAVLVAAVLSIVIGSLWYGPLFGKVWMREMGFTKERIEGMAKKGMGKTYALATLGSLVMAYILARFITLGLAFFPEVSPLTAGIHTAIWAWLGFVAPVTLGMVLWEGKSWTLWFILNSYQLVTLIAMGIILALWM